MKFYKLLIINLILSSTLASKKLCLKTIKKKHKTECLKCSESFLKDGVCKIPKKKIHHCKAYKNELNCSACNFGFFLKAGKCFKIEVKNCSAGPGKNICYICNKGLKLDENEKCEKKCQNKNSDFCFDFAGVEISASCKKGFSLNEMRKCVKQPTENCEIVKNGVCDTCRVEHYMKNGKCFGKNFVFTKIVELAHERRQKKHKLPLITLNTNKTHKNKPHPKTKKPVKKVHPSKPQESNTKPKQKNPHSKPHVRPHNKPHVNHQKNSKPHNKPKKNLPKPHSTKPPKSVTKKKEKSNKKFRKNLNEVKKKTGKGENHKVFNSNSSHNKIDEIEIKNNKTSMTKYIGLILINIQCLILILFF